MDKRKMNCNSEKCMICGQRQAKAVGRKIANGSSFEGTLSVHLGDKSRTSTAAHMEDFVERVSIDGPDAFWEVVGEKSGSLIA